MSRQYVNAGGQRLQGLVNRRADEVALFLKTPTTALATTTTTEKKGMKATMQAIYWKPNTKNPKIEDAYYFDGTKVHYLGHLDQIKILKQIYKDNNGHDMPEYHWTNKAPWWIRLEASLK